MEKRPSELMLLCAQSASQLRNLRGEPDDKAKLQEQLQLLEKEKAVPIKHVDEDEREPSESGRKVPRPMNSFMVFSHLERKRLAEENPELHNADLSKILGRKWKSLSPAQRQPYIDEAERLRVVHTETFPEYKYKPRRRKHPKRNTKRFSTLSANDVTIKTKLALNLDCALPPVGYHPLACKAETQTSFSSCSSPAEVSPATVQGNASVIFDNPAIPPTPGDSPLMSPDVHEIEMKAKEKSRFESNATLYNFLPPTPELSPLVTSSATRAAFNFDIPNSELKSETVYTCVMPRSVCSTSHFDATTSREHFVANTQIALPLITTFVPSYAAPEDNPVLPHTAREDGTLFTDVDRDEFDQYLGATLEKSQLSNSLRNIIAELEAT